MRRVPATGTYAVFQTGIRPSAVQADRAPDKDQFGAALFTEVFFPPAPYSSAQRTAARKKNIFYEVKYKEPSFMVRSVRAVPAE